MNTNGNTRKLRLLFCGHDFKFLTHFIQRCEQSPLFDVRVLEHPGHHIRNEAEAQEHLDWANFIFCEWAVGNAVWFSRRKRDDQLLFIRLHLQEVQARDRLAYIWQIDWSRVDKLILITHHVYDLMRQEFPELRQRAALIYNPIDACGSLNREKSDDARFTLGFVGMVPARKRLDVAVALLAELRQRDQRYHLRVKGKRPEDYPWMRERSQELHWYSGIDSAIQSLGLQDHVIFDPHGSDMPDWYEKIGHLVSTSDFEGSHQAVAEAMASGAVPAIRNWHGADRIYPPKYVAPSIRELADMVEQHSELETFRRESDYCRNFAQQRFDQTAICQKLEALLLQSCHHRFPGIFSAAVDQRRALPTFLILAYIPPGNRGGYRIRVEQEIKALVQTGCRVHLACLIPEAAAEDTAEKRLALANHRNELAHHGATVHFVTTEDFFRIDVSARDFTPQAEAIQQLIKENGIDILHAEALYCGRLGHFVKQRSPEVTFSIDWHGVIPEEERMNGAHEGRVRAMEQWEQKLLRATDLNVFVSEAMGRHYREKYGMIDTPHTLVPCCVSDERFARGHNTLSRTQLGIPEDAFVFAYAGTMAGWQCGEEMIRLFAALHREDATTFFLLLVPRGDHGKVLAWAQQYGLPEEACHLTEVRHDDVPAHLKLANMGVLLRKDDPVNRVSSPTKFGEYLAAGLPVLMTEGIGDYSDLAAREGVGIVVGPEALDPERTDQLAQQISAATARFATTAQSAAGRCQHQAYVELHWEPTISCWLAHTGTDLHLVY